MDLSRFIRKPHQARYDSPAVYHAFVFALPSQTDIYKLADRLLTDDLATAALPAGARKVRFAHRFRQRIRDRALAESLASLADVEEERIKFIKWARQNPRATAFLLQKNMLTWRRSKRGEKKEPNKELLAALNELTEAADYLKEKLTDAGLIMGVAGGVDRKLFRPGYLESEPFIRLEFGTLYVESDMFSGTELVISLVLHRSGIAVITFASTPGERSTDELLKVSAARDIGLKRTALPLGLYAAVSNMWDLEIEHSEWCRDTDSPDVLNDVTWKDPLPLDMIFQAYAHIVCLAAGDEDGDYGDWMCYTTVFVDGLLCCGSRKRWLARHRFELAGLSARSPAYALVKESVVQETLKSEHGGHRNHSLYFQGGNALSVDWAFGDDIEKSSPVDHLRTTVIVENVLIQFWKLYSLERLLSADKWTLANVASIQRQLITGLEEYRTTKLADEGSRRIEREITEKLELDRMYQHIIDRLNGIQQIIATTATQVGTRRNILVASIAAFAAVLLGVPAIKDILTVVTQVDTGSFPGVLAAPLKPLAGAGSTGVWTLYCITVLVTLLVTVIGFGKRRKEKNRRLVGKFGVPWDAMSYSLHQREYKEGKVILDPEDSRATDRRDDS